MPAQACRWHGPVTSPPFMRYAATLQATSGPKRTRRRRRRRLPIHPRDLAAAKAHSVPRGWRLTLVSAPKLALEYPLLMGTW
ncbi:hypothetical protein PsYK624_012360 [Phanerochaete sordida]|uniref:Uncharacterized protein n=1 Tax=Phanerochaete sordida TaxID=48140 RepID=A0A9P3FXT6_9APHY|nr:hypothetical protein PsYK624_012360 [Phanerochaete sordida]